MRKRLLTALPFTDNLVSVIAGLLAIATFAAGALGYVAKTERDERNELEAAVDSLERQGDDLRETVDVLTGENETLRDENEALEAQVDANDRTTTTTDDTPSTIPDGADGTPTTASYTQIYAAQDLKLTGSCYQQNAADLDVPRIGTTSYRWDVDYHNCGSGTAKLVFGSYTRHAPAPAGATAEQCADVLRRSGVGDDQAVIPQDGIVLCVQTTTDSTERNERPPRLVRMAVLAVDEGEQVTINVEAWEPD